jgi:hypothetical protein
VLHHSSPALVLQFACCNPLVMSKLPPTHKLSKLKI